MILMPMAYAIHLKLWDVKIYPLVILIQKPRMRAPVLLQNHLEIVQEPV